MIKVWISLAAFALLIFFAYFWITPREAIQVFERKQALPATQPGADATTAKVLGQVNTARPAASPRDEKNPIHTYRPQAGVRGRNQLDEILAANYPPTPAFAHRLRQLLPLASRDERIALARLLASVHDENDSSGLNAELLEDLKRLARDADPEVARTAASAYARLGYRADVTHVLEAARHSGAMSNADYFRELAHLVLVAPPVAQHRLLEQIQASKDAGAAEVLAFMFNRSPDAMQTLDAQSRARMEVIAEDARPAFGAAIGQVGITELIRYNEWMRFTARLRAASEQEVDRAIVDELARPDTDPRAVLAYLMSPEGRKGVASGVGSPAHSLLPAVERYAAQFPGNPNLQLMAAELARIRAR